MKRDGTRTDLEHSFYEQLIEAKVPKFFEQYKFHDGRRWKTDFIWLEHKVMVEVEGGIWTGGRHTRGAGFEGDCEKYNNAALLGYMLLRITGKHIKNGQGLEWTLEALKLKD